ncbi:MAG: hypothetical protein R6U78_09705 [Bacteroidales bacterium]
MAGLVDKELILFKLQELDRYLTQLKKHQGVTADHLDNNLDQAWIIEHGGIYMPNKFGRYVPVYCPECGSEDIIEDLGGFANWECRSCGGKFNVYYYRQEEK